MSINNYFPAKLAKDPYFCNRVNERQELERNIKLGRHTVLISPRRYGKSSLAHKVVRDMGIPSASIDLFLAHDDQAVTKRIMRGVSQVISQVVPATQKTLSTVQKYFNHFTVTLSAGGFGLQLEHNANLIDPIEQLLDSLSSLAKLVAVKRKKALLFIDEFQDIAKAENAKSIQGAIRHVAQDSSDLVFIFSGSNRHMLLELFDDSNKPLYMLCDKIILGRMSSLDYVEYIQIAAKKKWKKTLTENTLEKIFSCSELHPFYVNMLCNQVWKCSKLPTRNDIEDAWSACYDREERRLIAEIEKLTMNHQQILKTLAKQATKEPTGQSFLKASGLSMSSARLGINSLLEKDMVYKVKKEDVRLPQIQKNQLRVLDPLLTFALRKYS